MSELTITKIRNYENLMDLTEIEYGKNLPIKEFKDQGFPVFGANGIIGYYDKFNHKEEQVLISCRGANSGKINMSPTNCFITNNSLIVKIKNPKILDKKFLFYALQGITKNNIVSGSAQPQVTISNLTSISLPIPPIETQKKIVQKLDNVLGQLEENRKKFFKLQEKIDLELQKLSQTTNKREGKKTGIQQYYVDRIIQQILDKGNAKLESLMDCCIDIIDTPHSTVQYTNHGIHVIRTTDISPWNIDFSNAKFTSEETYLKRKQKIDPNIGDILYTREAPWGMAAVVTKDKFVVGQRILLLRPNQDKILPEFLCTFINSTFGYDQGLNVVNQTTSQHINIKDIKKFKIPIISTDEQKEFIKTIENKKKFLKETEQQISKIILSKHNLVNYFNNLSNIVISSTFSGKLVN